jgi:hypothetical protein
VAGSMMHVTWADGKVTKSKLERDGSSFTWDMGIFTPVKPLPGAKVLAGTYEGGESLSHGGNHAAVSKTLQLRADGTFSWSGVSFLQTTGARSQLAAGGQGATSGRWRTEGYSLLLTDQGGTVLRGIAFPYDDEKTAVYPDRLFFGGIMYRRQ